MFEKFAEKFCQKMDASQTAQRFLAVTPRQEKIMKWIFLPWLGVTIWFIFWIPAAIAAEPDFSKFFTVHEAKPILLKTQDAGG